MEHLHTKTLVIGSGPAGYTAAIYAARAMLEPILIEGLQPGGQLTITTEVENFPGFTSIQGPELMDRMKSHSESLGVVSYQDTITELQLDQKPFKAAGEGNKVYYADSIILAMGAQAKWIGLPSEQRLRGFGVSACATCDAFFFRGKKVVVVGGGNTAVEEALFLTGFASEVSLIHRRDSLRADKILQDKLFNNEKVNVRWNCVIEEITGDKKVSGIRLRNTNNNNIGDVECDGVFVAIGHTPSSQIVHNKLDLDESGYVIVKPGTTITSVPGVFAAGDISDPVYRQAITSAGMGCMAALDAERFLSM